MVGLRTAAIAFLCGLLGGALYLAVLLGSPGALILVYLTQLPLFVAGLWLGTGAAVIAGVTASLVLLAASDWLAAALFAALNAVPVIVLVRQALRARARPDGVVEWYPPGLLVAWLAALGLAGLGGAIVLLGGPHGVEAALREVLEHLIGNLGGTSDAEREAAATALATVMPGIVTGSWMMMAVINAALAQGLLVRFGRNWRPSPDPATLSLPVWISLTLALLLMATAFGGAMLDGAPRFVGINAMLVLAVPFGLVGLGVVHAGVRRLTHPATTLAVFYIVAGLFGWPLLLMIALGLVASGMGLRRRLAELHSAGGKSDG